VTLNKQTEESFQTVDLNQKVSRIDRLREQLKVIPAWIAEVRSYWSQQLKKKDTVASTTRGWKEYSFLFPECRNLEEIRSMVRKKVVADIGSGLTHVNPSALIHHAANDTERFVAIEPRAGYPVGHPKGFRPENSTHDVELLQKILDEVELPKRAEIIASDARQLPFEDGAIDILLSEAFFPQHIKTRKDILAVLREVARVLSEGGEARFEPVQPLHRVRLFYDPIVRKFLAEHFDVQVSNETNLSEEHPQYIRGDNLTLRLIRRNDSPTQPQNTS